MPFRASCWAAQELREVKLCQSVQDCQAFWPLFLHGGCSNQFSGDAAYACREREERGEKRVRFGTDVRRRPPTTVTARSF